MQPAEHVVNSCSSKMYLVLPSLIMLLVVIFWKKNALLALASAVVVLVMSGAFVRQGFLYDAFHVLQDVFSSNAHWKIIGFSFGINWMVFWLNQERFLQKITNRFLQNFSSKRAGLHIINFLGYVVFFDDYANTMLIGGIGQDIARKYRISKEKLAYIVDATAAPIASISLVSTWIGFEVGLIEKGLEDAGLSGNVAAYGVFLDSIPYMFYAWFTLIFIFFLNHWQRDFGPMLKAEKAFFEREEKEESADRGMLASIVVFGSFVFGTFGSIVYTAIKNDAWSWSFEIIRNADFVSALFFGALFATVSMLGIGLKRSSVKEFSTTFIETAKVFVPVLALLFAAWTYGDLIQIVLLSNSDFLSILQAFPNVYIIIGSYLLSILLSAITGSSWSTMSIVFPIILPVMLNGAGELSDLPICCAAIMSGAVIGDHISPISDTTILSATACGCSVNQHFITQAPYALVVASIALISLLLTTVFTVPIWMVFIVGILLIIVIIRLLGQKFGN